MVRSFTAAAAAIATIATVQSASAQKSASAQSCAELNGQPLAQGQLFALFDHTGTRRIIPLEAGMFGNEIDFYHKIKLIYVVDGPSKTPLMAAPTDRDHSGVIAVRLVSTGGSANAPLRPPQFITLSRDPIVSRRSERRAWQQDISALRYYVYHHPRGLRSSDSLLEREFHTEYTVRASEPDRSTYDPQDRRSRFHFPEMIEADPPGVFGDLPRRLLGSSRALAATRETRFESQIKYYRRSAQPRCITIVTQIQPTDDGSLAITLIDLDHPGGPLNPWAAERWTINWKPTRVGAR